MTLEHDWWKDEMKANKKKYKLKVISFQTYIKKRNIIDQVD